MRLRLLLLAPLMLCTVGLWSACSSTQMPPQEAIPLLKSEQTEAIAARHTQITLRANHKSCAIFLNGEYQGTTTLSIRDLPQGAYHLRLEKSGFAAADYLVTVSDGKHEYYYVELQPLAEPE